MRIVDAAECASQAEAIRMAVFTFDHLIAAQQRDSEDLQLAPSLRSDAATGGA